MRASCNRTFLALAMTCVVLLGPVLCGCGAADPAGQTSGRDRVALATNPLAPGTRAPGAPVSPSAAPASFAAAGAGQGGGKRPNIVFVLTDDLAWNLVPY
ncbi:MAG TPA: hypothetical protein VID70_07390, partial [Solirubrobacteraceae bacterium]